jgi:hypothetical protein
MRPGAPPPGQGEKPRGYIEGEYHRDD